MKKIFPLIVVWLICLSLVYIVQNSNGDKKLSKLDKKLHPSDYFFYQRAYPHSEIPYDKYLDAIEKKNQMESDSPMGDIDWIPAGPYNIGGRITAMTVDPGNTNIMIIGAAAGGVFKTTNSGIN